MPTIVSQAVADRILNAGIQGSMWVSMHTADPGATGAALATGVGRVALALDEVQTVTITGGPTGGSFTLSYGGQTTAAIAYNATAAAVQAALEALSTIGDDEVVCAGGPLPGTAVTVRFTAGLGHQDIAMMTADGALLTGGTTPAVTVAETVKGMERFSAFVNDTTVPTNRKTDNDAILDFGDSTAAETYTHGGFWDAQTGGTFLYGDALTTSVTVQVGSGLTIPVGNLVLVGGGF